MKHVGTVRAGVLAALGTVLATGPMTAFGHGESLRGGGSGSINAVGAAIVEQPVISLRWDARRYETFTDQQMVQFRVQGEDVHMHSSEDAYFLTVAFPFGEDNDISIMTQYNSFKGFKDNGDDAAIACFDPDGDGVVENADTACISPTAKSAGFGDTLLTWRHRFYNDGESQWSSVFGVIIPTGKITNLTDRGEVLGTHNQPGSGAIIFQGGVAFSGHLTEKIAIDADVLYRVPSEGAKEFRSGKSWQLDVAAAFNHHSTLIPVVELNGIFADPDVENDQIKKNSGGDVVYLSPGINFRINKGQSLYANFSYPIYQELGGISNDEKYRWSLGWAANLGG